MNQKHLWYRTQRFPRSISEAFRDARYGAAIEISTRRSAFSKFADVLLWIAVGCIAVMAAAAMVTL